MLNLAAVKLGEVVYDLGAGDGRMLSLASQRYSAKAVGIELSRERFEGLKRLAKEDHNIEVVQEDMFRSNIAKADVVLMYLTPKGTGLLKPKLEVHPDWATNVTVGFGRLDGASVGIVANQPIHLSGALDSQACMKAARFIRTCDCFNIPIITFVDVPGYLPGPQEEHSGIIRHGTKLLYAYCEATVPKITTIVRKAYGGAYCAMNSKFSRADINYAWPTAEIAVMGPEGAVNIIFRKEIAKARNKVLAGARLTKEYRERSTNPYVAASRGIIDEIIDPALTRPKLIAALSSLKNKSEFRPRKKHGNVQL